MKTVFALLILLGCCVGCGGAYRARVYGQSGALYQAPNLCQAVAECMKAGETTCLYAQSSEYNCGDKLPEPQAKK